MARVLVVDDEKLIVKGIRFSLEQDGYEVDCAYDGEEAIEMAKKTEYDIVLFFLFLAFCLHAATDNGTDPCLYFQDIKGLADIIICPVFQSQDLIHITALCSQHDHRHI